MSNKDPWWTTNQNIALATITASQNWDYSSSFGLLQFVLLSPGPNGYSTFFRYQPPPDLVQFWKLLGIGYPEISGITWYFGYTLHFGATRNIGSTLNTRKYPTYLEIPESKQGTRKYPIEYFNTSALLHGWTRLLPDISFNTWPEPARYKKNPPVTPYLSPFLSIQNLQSIDTESYWHRWLWPLTVSPNHRLVGGWEVGEENPRWVWGASMGDAPGRQRRRESTKALESPRGFARGFLVPQETVFGFGFQQK